MVDEGQTSQAKPLSFTNVLTSLIRLKDLEELTMLVKNHLAFPFILTATPSPLKLDEDSSIHLNHL